MKEIWKLSLEPLYASLNYVWYTTTDMQVHKNMSLTCTLVAQLYFFGGACNDVVLSTEDD